MRFNASGIKNAPISSALDAGEYVVNITKVDTTPSNGGTPAVNITGVVEDGPVQQSGSLPTGKNIFCSLYFSEKSQEISMSQLKKLWSCAALEIPDDEQLELADLIGRKVIFVTKIEEYEGEYRTRVKSFKAVK